MRSLRLLPLLLPIVACASTTPVSRTTTTAAAVVDCGPDLPGFDKIAEAKLVILGELHGQVGPPAFAANLACREATKAPATLALEISADEQPRIDAFLGSDGGDAARASLLEGRFWRRAIQDGRSSAAMLAMLQSVRGWKAAGLPLRVAAVEDGNERAAVSALVAAQHGPVVFLTSNPHPALLKSEIPALVALEERSGPGDGWMCLTGDPNECGKKPIGTSASGQPGPTGTIDVFAKPDEHGFTGSYSVGAAQASEPAIGVSTAQETAAAIHRFRLANQRALSLEERSEWCGQLMPIAEKQIPLEGDAFQRTDVCEGTLTPARSRQIVPDTKVKFDLGFFVRHPRETSAYDRDTRTILLPLSATYEPWTDGAAANHEWLHARHHLNARNGFTLDSALMTTASDFTADEVPVIMCDVIHHRLEGEALNRADAEVRRLRKLLDTLAPIALPKKKGRQARAGVAGTLVASPDGVERWVGGKDPKKSLALLEGVWRDAATALLALKASPPDVHTATSVALLAGDVCDPSK